MMHTIAGALLFLAAGIAADQRPNILIIVADDLGWNDVSFHGSEQIPTPNLDALAYDGILLTNYYVQPICTPSRSALMTGRHPIHTGLQHEVIMSYAAYGLGLNETIFPQYLKELGFRTHIIGKWEELVDVEAASYEQTLLPPQRPLSFLGTPKWHLGFFADEYTPTYRGYDSFFGYLGGKEDYWDHTNSEGQTQASWGLDLYYNTTIVKDQFGQYSTEIFTKRAEQIIHYHDKSKPMFMYLPYQAIHSGNNITPLEAPYEYMQKFQHIQHKGRRTVAAMTSALDDGIGRVISALSHQGMLNNTVIVFTTDNGGPANGFDVNYANNFPLRGLKATLWEGGMRGDGFVWSPLLTSSPRQSDQMMHITDWLPTLLHAAGYDESALTNRSLDGVDQWRELVDDLPARRTEMIHNIDPLGGSSSKRQEWYALRLGEHKVVYTTNADDGWYPPEGVALGEFTNRSVSLDEKPLYAFPAPKDSVIGKILLSMGRGTAFDSAKPVKVDCGPKPANASTNCVPYKAPCLYNVVQDPCEYHNIADQNPDTVGKLLDRVKEYRKGMVWPKNKPTDPNSLPGKHGGVWGPWIKLNQEL